MTFLFIFRLVKNVEKDEGRPHNKAYYKERWSQLEAVV